MGAEDRMRTRAEAQATVHRGPAVPLGPCLGLSCSFRKTQLFFLLFVFVFCSGSKTLDKNNIREELLIFLRVSWVAVCPGKEDKVGTATNRAVKKLRKKPHSRGLVYGTHFFQLGPNSYFPPPPKHLIILCIYPGISPLIDQSRQRKNRGTPRGVFYCLPGHSQFRLIITSLPSLTWHPKVALNILYTPASYLHVCLPVLPSSI